MACAGIFPGRSGFFEIFADLFFGLPIVFSELSKNTIMTLFCQKFSAPQANCLKIRPKKAFLSTFWKILTTKCFFWRALSLKLIYFGAQGASEKLCIWTVPNRCRKFIPKGGGGAVATPPLSAGYCSIELL